MEITNSPWLPSQAAGYAGREGGHGASKGAYGCPGLRGSIRKQHVGVSEQLQMRERWPVGNRRAASTRPSPLNVH